MKPKEEISRLLKTVADNFYKEDSAVRERQIRHWRRLKFYWNNLSNVYWAEDIGDYVIAGANGVSGGGGNVSGDQGYYDKPVNVFKAFLETIIAALSIQIPSISCVPDDADNPLDLSTAKAGNKISSLIYRHNDIVLLWLHALYIYCTEGLIATYTYSKDDKEFGTYQKPKYKNEKIESYVCPNCFVELDEAMFNKGEEIKDKEINEFGPDDNDVALENAESRGIVCPECAVELDPNLQKSQLVIPKLIGFTTAPKSRICIEVYGGLYIKVALYAKEQSGTPYLDFSYETHYANALEMYPELKDKISQGGWQNSGMNNSYEQYGRLNTQYGAEYPSDVVTIHNTWLRPASFNILPEEDCNKLKKLFPDGTRIVFVNDVCAEYENENLDDCWTLNSNPLSDYLTYEPLGELVTNIQDIISDLISLTLQTIEHGIAQTWADPAVVNFDQYSQIEATPGLITPTKPVGGAKNISESFFNTKTATLSPEIFEFYRIIQELGQFVSGALPSIFGGKQGAGASNTASEYAMSQKMALQKLQTPWRMLTILWKKTMGKAIPLYMKNMVDDERVVEKNAQGKYVNTFIRRSELEGKIGDIELEPSDQLPVSEDQQKDFIMKIMELNNAELQAALLSPENLPFLRKVVRIPDFKLPGEEDRQKQYEEIQELIQGEPLLSPPDPMEIEMSIMEGLPEPQEQELPSIEIDELIDNHKIEADICRSWLISEEGRLAKKENPLGYKNVLLHMKQHMDFLQQTQMASLPTEEETPDSSSKPKGARQQGPDKIKDNKDAIAPVS